MRSALATLLVATLAVVAGTRAFGKKAEKTPDKVRKAVEAHFGKQVTIDKEDEDGTVAYEAATTTKLEAVFSDTGQLRETEVAIPLGSLPSAVASAVQAKLAKGAKVAKAEVIIKPDSVAFEVEAKLANGDEVEYLVDASGKILAEQTEGRDGDEADDDDND